MNLKLCIKILSGIVVISGLFLILPAIVSIIYNDGEFTRLFLIAISCIFIGAVLFFLIKQGNINLSHRDGFFIVSSSWILFSLIGALPFYFSKYFNSFDDAFFESASGFTTTGSTILTNIESVAPSLLFWRSLIQWLGGMGFIVLSIAILPFLGIGGMQLYKSEVPGPTKDKLTPRIEDTAKLLWLVYVILTIFEIILLKIGGMSLFDSICHSFTTMATGGFSPKNASIAAYNSAYIDWVITLFMFLAGINFKIHYLIIIKHRFSRDIINNETMFYFIFTFLTIGIFTFFNLFTNVYGDILSSLRYSAFQVVSILTTTGFGTADYEKWHPVLQFILILLMIVGGCAGSTGGGIKNIRIYIYLKYTLNQILKVIHPNSVKLIKIDGKIVDNNIISSIISFISLYFLVFVISSILVTAFGGQDLITSLSAVIATMSNIGPGLGNVGPVDNFSGFTPFAKFILSLSMIIGRLEFYTVIVLFSPTFWKGVKFK